VGGAALIRARPCHALRLWLRRDAPLSSVPPRRRSRGRVRSTVGSCFRRGPCFRADPTTQQPGQSRRADIAMRLFSHAVLLSIERYSPKYRPILTEVSTDTHRSIDRYSPKYRPILTEVSTDTHRRPRP